MAFSGTAISAYVAVASAAASAISSYQGQVAAKNARRGQREQQAKAESAALSAEREAGMREKEANPRAPDALALLGKERLASMQGIGTSSLTAPNSITPKITLGTRKLLG